MSAVDIAERLVARIAGLSDEQKNDAVKKVMTNLEAKSKDKKSKGKSKKKEEPEEKKSKAKGKKTKKKEEEPKEEPKEEVVEESEMSDDASMDSVEALSKELEQIKQDGKVDPQEVVSLFQTMMGMVDNLLRAKPGRKPKASLEDRVAARGLQTRRKDKDLMSDTGGSSKGRRREPEQKPPREDVKKNNRTKNKPAESRDTDTDNDKDMKASVRQAMISLDWNDAMKQQYAPETVHPLDRKAEFWGMPIPEDNYYRRVWSSLTGILADRRGVSEKAFQAYDELMAEVDGFLRTSEAMDVVSGFESEDKRPSFCAECLFDKIGS